MKKLIVLGVSLVLLVGLVIGWGTIREVGAQIAEYFTGDPDMPFETGMSKQEFMQARSEAIGRRRGLDKNNIPDPKLRQDAIRQIDEQERAASTLAPQAAWTEIGPNPIPNGQTNGVSNPVSGRTISIAVDPTNANLVYAGTAQGGLYKTTDGGTTWTPLMDNAMSLAIGAIAIAPSQPGTIYVGTGEPNFSLDSYFGVGVYRIDNANTASPIVSGPFNKNSSNADIFTGQAISRIAVSPTDPNTIYLATSFGLGGIGGVFPASTPAFGLFRSTNAAGASPTFAKIDIFAGNSPQLNITDVVMDPGDANRVICVTGDAFSAAALSQRGIYLSTNALAATPTFTRTQALNTPDRTELTINRVGSTVTAFAASGLGTGQVYRSVDGGATWTLRIDNNFCNPQCFYDVAIAVDPTNASNVYVGGSPTLIFGRSTDGGTTFTNNAATAIGLHSDSHAIAVAPSLPTTIYFGSDGGIWRSTNSGTTWTALNNTTFRATQFMGLAVHPTDPDFTLGGTQDNGTNFFRPGGTWTRADFGDGGYAVIDQNAADTTNVRMYHTYFNQTNAMGYVRVTNVATAVDNGWTGFGCGFSGFIANGMTCTASAILFYAPLEQGPGNPNTLYFGSDVLYRSSDGGTTVTKVSQEPIQSAVAISAIGISRQNDNVRIVGEENGNLFGTTTGSATLTNLDPTNIVPSDFVARAVIDPNNVNTAYVTLDSYGGPSVWRTTNLSNVPPTWMPLPGTGGNTLPQIPVNGFLIDPTNSAILYAGTDIGVYSSIDSGANWLPFGTGLPRIAVFDLAKTSGGLIRIATHGRGMWQTPALGGSPTPTPTNTNTPTATPTSTGSPSGTPAISGTVTYGNAISGPTPPRPVSNVTLSGTGSVSVNTTTSFPAGTYTLTGFGAGAYTVTPTKTTGVNGITSFDAARIAQHVAGTNPLTGNALVVADVSTNGTVTSFDAAEISNFVVTASPAGATGTWRFVPPNRAYASVTGSITGQDYSALLMGEVSGNWTNTGARAGGSRQSAGDSVTDTPGGPERGIAVAAPRLVTPSDAEVLIPVSVEGTADKGIIAYEFDLRYDPAVIQPKEKAVDLADTLSSKLSVAVNAEEAGLLRVAVYGAKPIDGSGVLLNLRFTAVGAPGAVSPLTWERVMLNEDEMTATDGQVELSVAAPNEAEITGRLLTPTGEGVPHARVTLTDSTGQRRSVLSNGFGVYTFVGLQVGQTYTIRVASRSFAFTPLTVSSTGQLTNVDMIAEQ